MVTASGTMAPKPRTGEIKAMQNRLCNEPTNSEASGSMKELDVRLNLGVKC